MKTFRKIKVNQYTRRRRHVKGAWFLALLLFALLLVVIVRKSNNTFIRAYIESYDTRVVMASEPEVTPTPTPTISVDIKQYIKTIFGKDARVACAVARAESGFNNKGQLVSSVENSRGIFQINLQSEYAKVHYDRVPGNTLEEKITWLEDPYNSTLMAYWIFSKSGWSPWSVFTSGKYEQFLGECK